MKNSSKIVIYGKKNYEKNNVIWINENSFHDPPLDFERTMLQIDEMQKIENSSLNNKTLYELFSYDDFSFWGFFYEELFQNYSKLISFTLNFYVDYHLKEKKSKIMFSSYSIF